MRIVKYIKIFQLNIISSIEYRANFILKLISGIVPLIVQIFLWNNVFRVADKTQIVGYGKLNLIIYIIIATALTKLLAIDNHENIAREIKMGELHTYMVKPINHMAYWLSCEIGSKIFYYILMTGIFTVLNLLTIRTSIIQILLGWVFVFLAMILNYFIFYLISILSFWFVEISSIFTATNMILIFVGGGIIPLDIILNRTLNIVVSPISLIFYFPTNLFVRNSSINLILIEMVIAVAWITFFSLISNSILKIGLKKYIAVGG